MALIKCPKCGKEISSLSPQCPLCGLTKEEREAWVDPNISESMQHMLTERHDLMQKKTEGVEEMPRQEMEDAERRIASIIQSNDERLRNIIKLQEDCIQKHESSWPEFKTDNPSFNNRFLSYPRINEPRNTDPRPWEEIARIQREPSHLPSKKQTSNLSYNILIGLVCVAIVVTIAWIVWMIINGNNFNK